MLSKPDLTEELLAVLNRKSASRGPHAASFKQDQIQDILQLVRENTVSLDLVEYKIEELQAHTDWKVTNEPSRTTKAKTFGFDLVAIQKDSGNYIHIPYEQFVSMELEDILEVLDRL